MRIATVLSASLLIGGCAALPDGWRDERVVDHRKAELCRDLETSDAPHCAGGRPSARDVPGY